MQYVTISRQTINKGHYFMKYTFIVMLALIILVTSSVSASNYRITDLGALIDSTYSRAYDINNNCQVVGYFRNDSGYHPFLYNQSDDMQNLSTLSGDSTLQMAYGINDSDTVVGYLNSPGSAFSWNSASGVSDYGRGYAYGINEYGVSVGESGGMACFWDTKGVKTMLLSTNSYNVCTAYAINSSGQMVGDDRSVDGRHAFIWYDADHRQDLGAFSGTSYSCARSINNSGIVVGYSCNYNTYAIDSKAFIWDSENLLQEIIIDGGLKNFAYDINNLGEVVGSSADSSGIDRPFIWDNTTGVHYLNALSDEGGKAFAINDDGWIVGWSMVDGVEHAVLWQPVPEPSSMVCILGGLLCTFSIARRRRH